MAEQTAGRDLILDRLLTAVEAGRGALVTGSIGVGRSHLAHAVARRVRESGRPTIELHGTAAGRDVPSAALATLVAVGLGESPTRPSSLRQLLPRRPSPGRRPLVVVDDAGLVDDVTLAEVLTLARAGEVVVVATCTSGASSDPRVADLWRSDLLDRHALAPLSRADADRLLEGWLPGPASVALSGAAWAAAQGNPLVLREWLTAARDGGVVRQRESYWELEGPVVPGDRLRDLAGRHLEGAPDDAREALLTVVLAEPVPLGLLDAVVASGDLALLERRKLVAVDDRGVVTTTTPVVADVLRHDTGPLQRRVVLGRLVDAAATTTVDVDPVRLATWTLVVGATPDAELAARAAPLALSRFDASLAERLAVQLPPTTSSLLVVGRARAMQGQVADGLEQLHRAVEVAADPRELVEAHASVVEVTSLVQGDRQAANAHLREALTTVEDPDLRQQLEVRCQLLSGLDGRFEGVLAAGRLLDEVELPPVVEAHGLVAHTLAQSMTGQVDGMLDRLARAEALTADLAADHPALGIQVGMTRVLALHALLRFDEAATLTDRMLGQSRPDLSLGPWLTIDMPGTLYRGELGVAAVRLEQARTLLARGDAIGLQTIARAITAVVAAMRGHGDTSEIEALRALPGAQEPRSAVWVAAAPAWLAARSGDLDAAAEHARGGGLAAVELDHVVWGAIVMHTATRIGRADAVAGVMGELGGGHGPLVDLLVEHTAAAADGDRGALAAVASRWDEAGLVAVAADAWAGVAQAARADGDAIGTARAATRAYELSSRCATYPVPLLADLPSPLSGRQHAVARLAANGHSSRDIGVELDIAAKTVDNHLHAVYRQLDLDGRDQLAEVIGHRQGALTP